MTRPGDWHLVGRVADPTPGESWGVREIAGVYGRTVTAVRRRGKLLVLDTTNEYLSPGAVPAYLAGKQALLVAGDKSRIVTLPGVQAAAHRIERTIVAQVQADAAVNWRRRAFARGALLQPFL